MYNQDLKNNCFMDRLIMKSNIIIEKNNDKMEEYNYIKKKYNKCKNELALINKTLDSKITLKSVFGNSLKKKQDAISESILNFNEDMTLEIANFRQEASVIKDDIENLKNEIKELKISKNEMESKFKPIEREYYRIAQKVELNIYKDVIDLVDSNNQVKKQVIEYGAILYSLCEFCSDVPNSVELDFDITFHDNIISLPFIYLNRPEDNCSLHISPTMQDIVTDIDYNNCFGLAGIRLYSPGIDNYLDYFYKFFKNLKINDIHFDSVILECLYFNTNQDNELNNSFATIRSTITNLHREEVMLTLSFSKYPVRNILI
jgi:hypothetical protein